MNDAPDCSEFRMSWFSDTCSTTYMDENLGQTSEIQLNEICTDTHLQAVVGKTVRGSSIGVSMGKCTELGMPICSSKTRILF